MVLFLRIIDGRKYRGWNTLAGNASRVSPVALSWASASHRPSWVNQQVKLTVGVCWLTLVNVFIIDCRVDPVSPSPCVSNAPGRSWTATRCGPRLRLRSLRRLASRPPGPVHSHPICVGCHCARLTECSSHGCSCRRRVLFCSCDASPRIASPGRGLLRRSRCSRLTSLAPSRCASSQVWLRFSPLAGFRVPALGAAVRAGAPPSSARHRARDSRPGHEPAERDGPRTTLALAAQVPARGARGWFLLPF